MLLDIVVKGSTDRSVTVSIIDSSDGTPETGVVFNTSGIDLWYRRQGAAKTSITEATLSALTDAHSDGGFLHIGDGVYRLDLPDAAFATGAQHVDIGGTVTGMIVIGGRVRLIDSNIETANMPADMVSISGDSTAAENLEGAFDDTVGSVPWMGILDQGTAQAATSTTLQLRAAVNFADDTIVGCVVMAFGATQGYWQVRTITDYVSSTDTATVDAWTVTPTGAITYKVLAAPSVVPANLTQYLGTAVPTADTAGYPKVTLKTGTGTGELSVSSGRVALQASLRKNTALANFPFLMTDSTNHNPMSGLTVTGTRSLDGASFGGGTITNMTEVGNGVYQCDLGAGDLNGDTVALRFTATGADDLLITLVTEP